MSRTGSDRARRSAGGGGGKHRATPRSGTRRRSALIAGRGLLALVSLAVIAVMGLGWSALGGLSDEAVTSDALVGVQTSQGDDVNLLIMGLDSRLDKNGRPLSDELYAQLHAGDESVGGYNANVLMLVHLPADGGRATILAIPRDDYVDLPGCPSGVCRGKIKEAYGLAVGQYRDEVAATDPSAEPDEHATREAGRASQIAAVRALLGDVPIDHFAEVTMAAFYELAAIVEPIPVCLLEDTADTYSGADFTAGHHDLNAREAMAFVRQRRDIDESKNFTDLDRSRRQQAFLISLASRLSEGRVLLDTGRLSRLVDTAHEHMTFDNDLDIVAFARLMDDVRGREIDAHTLPTAGFATLADGSEVNIIDPVAVRAVVAELLGTGTRDEPAGAEPVDLTGTTVTVLNAAGVTGLAGAVSQALAGLGAAEGPAANAPEPGAVSQIRYGPGAGAPARALAEHLSVTDIAADPDAGDTAITLTVAADLAGSPVLDELLAEHGAGPAAGAGGDPGGETGPFGGAGTMAVPADGMWFEHEEELPTQISGADIPCVR